MKKGYILIFTIYTLLFSSIIFTVKFNDLKMFYNVENESENIYKRLRAEKYVFDEILSNLYIYDDEDFELYFEDYYFYTTIDDTEVKISVEGLLEYTINLKYNDDCICFIEILYK